MSMSYDVHKGLDPFKVVAQAWAAETDAFAERFGARVVPWTRGESVFVMRFCGAYIGFVIEGLGTKNLVADRVRNLIAIAQSIAIDESPSFYHALAQDCVAMIVNDMITLGIFPMVIGMHPAVASSDWFKDGRRNAELIQGWRRACEASRCVWGPGETPGLDGVIVPDTLCLSGAGVGTSKGALFDPRSLQAGDCIHLLTSSGIHANGLTLARRIAEKVPDGYLALLSDGRTYGETLLDPTHLYTRFVEDCVDAGVTIRYAVNITGHGWRKLMRAPGNLAYIMDEIPAVQPVFNFMMREGPVTVREAYGTFNMNAGFALYTPPNQAALIRTVMDEGDYPFELLEDAGHIEESPQKKVVIKPVFEKPGEPLTFEAQELAVR